MQKTSENYTNVRWLAGMKSLAYALSIICILAATVMLVIGIFAEERVERTQYSFASITLSVGGMICHALREKLKARIRNAYFDAPLGVFFTGSLFRSRDWHLLPGLEAGTHASSTRLSRSPYPDAVAIGANGVVKAWNEVAWFAHLVTVNGQVNVTRICPAEYGWQAFIMEKIY